LCLLDCCKKRWWIDDLPQEHGAGEHIGNLLEDWRTQVQSGTILVNEFKAATTRTVSSSRALQEDDAVKDGAGRVCAHDR
jgi:hypothetical protein